MSTSLPLPSNLLPRSRNDVLARLSAVLNDQHLSDAEGDLVSFAALLHFWTFDRGSGSAFDDLALWIARHVATDDWQRMSEGILTWASEVWPNTARPTARRKLDQIWASTPPGPCKELLNALVESKLLPTNGRWHEALHFLHARYDPGFVDEFLGYPAFVKGFFLVIVDSDWPLPSHRLAAYPSSSP